MKAPLFVANWKMNKLAAEAKAFAEGFIANYSPRSDGFADAWIAPPLTAFHALRNALGTTKIPLGGQNVHWLPSGAHTGEVSAPMLHDFGASFAIVGHSERRQYYGETSETVAKRALAALQTGLRVIVCIGESRTEFEAHETAKVVEKQLRASLASIGAELFDKLIIAYEPVWAIGTGLSATPEIAASVHAQIRLLLREIFGTKSGDSIHILYGGSTTPENIGELLKGKDVEGALIGGASLKPDSFCSLIANGRKACT